MAIFEIECGCFCKFLGKDIEILYFLLNKNVNHISSKWFCGINIMQSI